MKKKAPAQDVNVVNPPGQAVPVEIVNRPNQPGRVEIHNRAGNPVEVTGALVGNVTVSNQPTLTAVQSGTWKVEVQNPGPPPTAPTLPPDFVVGKIVEW